VEKRTKIVITTPKMATKIPYKSAVTTSAAPSTVAAGVVVADPAFVALDVPLGGVDPVDPEEALDILAYSLRR
jgi:ABC-type lipopolysaccharide export system ATPase subunit